MSARAHAERFLAACPEDVRARARVAELRSLTQVLFGANGNGFVQMLIHDDAECTIYTAFPGRAQVERHTTIDRLLSGYTPEQNLTASTIRATASQTGQGGNLLGMGGEASHRG